MHVAAAKTNATYSRMRMLGRIPSRGLGSEPIRFSVRAVDDMSCEGQMSSIDGDAFFHYNNPSTERGPMRPPRGANPEGHIMVDVAIRPWHNAFCVYLQSDLVDIDYSRAVLSMFVLVLSAV